jgi:predicted pyridoxine 5'-phosphate oxidase superfamily flavin-nucleotide-binding protein
MDNQVTAFHQDEREAQRRAGFDFVTGAIRPFMPAQHREFFALLPYVVVATVDDEDWPIATMLSGAPGFVHAPDPVTLRVDASVQSGDPAAEGIVAGREIGILGIDFATRRRNRANGRIASRDPAGFTVTVHQSFGNCAQYIQRRTVQSVARVLSADIETMTALDPAARRMIAEADTFFVASRSGPRSSVAGGVDVSHRGGLPGFIHIANDTIVIPDFRGNRYFNTLGNLLGEPRASLLFVDFATGDLLQLQGLTEIDWSDAVAEHIEGAERSWRFHPTLAWRRRGAIPLRWSFVDYAPTTRRAGVWK